MVFVFMGMGGFVLGCVLGAWEVFFCAVFLESEAGSSPPPFLWNSLLFMERKG